MCVDRGYRLLFQEAWVRWEEEWQVTALAQALENPEHLVEDKEAMRGGS